MIDAFLKLKPAYQAVVEDITKRMGHGMAHYATAGINVETTADYDEYCHYVAGLVGLGLSEMFSACGFECKPIFHFSCEFDKGQHYQSILKTH